MRQQNLLKFLESPLIFYLRKKLLEKTFNLAKLILFFKKKKKYEIKFESLIIHRKRWKLNFNAPLVYLFMMVTYLEFVIQVK